MNTKGRDYVRDKMPLIGLGTYQIKNEQTIFDIIDAALGCGYRFIDTAQIYGNERYIGNALRELLPKHNLQREDIFITSKLSPANQGKGAGKSIKKSLDDLQTAYIDLLLIHWPGANKFKVNNPKNRDLRRETWTVMEELFESDALKSIGVSNYEIKHLEDLLCHAKVLPAVNQCEFHPYFHQMDLVNFCKDKDIHFQAYSSFGSPSGRGSLFSDETVKNLAEKNNITVPILLLAWAINQEISVLPRSSKPEHVVQNYSAINDTILEEDIQKLMLCNKVEKFCWDPSTVV